MVDSTEIASLQEISTFVCLLDRALIKKHKNALPIAKKKKNNKRRVTGK